MKVRIKRENPTGLRDPTMERARREESDTKGKVKQRLTETGETPGARDIVREHKIGRERERDTD